MSATQSPTISPVAAPTLGLSVGSAGATQRPLRRDAERNRQRILDAAATVFADRGLDVTMDDIAVAAGVGVGTVYRRFPDKEQLIDALFEQSIAGIVDLADEAAKVADPWEGFVSFVERTQELLVADRALAQLIHSSIHGRQRVSECREQMVPQVERLVERAQAAGKLRSDVCGIDIAMITLMLNVVADYTNDVAPGTWRRYMAIVLDGLRVDAHQQGSLGSPALARTQFDSAMQHWRPGAR